MILLFSFCLIGGSAEIYLYLVSNCPGLKGGYRSPVNKCLKNIIYNAFLDSDLSAEYGFLRLTLVQTGAAHSVM